LDKSLLLMMLKRGGWVGSVDHRSPAELPGSAANKMSEEWWLSKCLSRECSLGPHWRGDGLPRYDRASGRAGDRLSPGKDRRRGARSTSLEMTSVTDFSEIVSNYADVEDVPGSSVHFTVSVCGRYVLVAEGCLVYIYRLSGRESRVGSGGEGTFLGGSLRPVTSVFCPRRVLAVSMDTSCERYAVAALLDGRVGMVCDIGGRIQSSSVGGGPGPPLAQGAAIYPGSSTVVLPQQLDSTHFQRIAEDRFPFPGEELEEISNELEESSRVWAAAGSSGIDNEGLARLGTSGNTSHILSEHVEANGLPIMAVVGGIPVETGPSAVYRNVCSTDDPPVSVAICPQRKCVGM
jgi:hypothetical protein